MKMNTEDIDVANMFGLCQMQMKEAARGYNAIQAELREHADRYRETKAMLTDLARLNANLLLVIRGHVEILAGDIISEDAANARDNTRYRDTTISIVNTRDRIVRIRRWGNLADTLGDCAERDREQLAKLEARISAVEGKTDEASVNERRNCTALAEKRRNNIVALLARQDDCEARMLEEMQGVTVWMVGMRESHLKRHGGKYAESLAKYQMWPKTDDIRTREAKAVLKVLTVPADKRKGKNLPTFG